ncbi:right-handed parallel beta-helix repeat-containing protein [Catalinimonas alkaloidigena]|uniref:right-handed parallel beta-helix repeat-containing protein n=1 Tax=Catalinimonas alkaloidigena TaxID=1075417 RepID=UPI001C40BAD6|nr:right-handed parallel beta-helix repeat-containing protein [Catalinimonas alkaloidigena]
MAIGAFALLFAWFGFYKLAPDQKSLPLPSHLQADIAATPEKPSPATRTNLTPLAQAPEVYVAPNGNDAADGSQQHPYLTLRRALQRVTAGGTIHLAAGTYREGELQITRGGTAQQPLILQGAGPEKTFLKGSAEINDWRVWRDNIWQAPWSTNSQQLFMDGQPLQQVGSQSGWHFRKYLGQLILKPVGETQEDLTPGSFYYDHTTQTMYCQLPDGADPNAHLMEASVQKFVLEGPEAAHVRLQGIGFAHSNGSEKGVPSYLVQLGAHHWTAEDCNFDDGDFMGLKITGDNHTVRRCQFRRNGDSGINMNGQLDDQQPLAPVATRTRAPMHILIDSCTVTDNNTRRFMAIWHAGGIKCVPLCRDVTVRNCVVKRNRGNGIWFDTCFGDITIENNEVSENDNGIMYEISYPLPGDQVGALIRNNLVTNNKKHGIYISASSAAVVEHNTVWHNWVNVCLHGMPRKVFELKNNTVTDNLIGEGKHADMIVFTGEKAGDNVLKGNYYATDAQHRQPLIGIVSGKGYDITHRTIEALTRATGQEAGGQAGTLEWQTGAEVTRRLPASSPAVGKGRQLP